MSESTGPILRRLRTSDIPAALQLSTEAGWNQTEEDWRMLIDLAPEGCLALELDSELASTATLFCYGRRLAWVGMVLTRIAYRGRGFARRLLTETLALADQMQIETVKLDATDQGQPLYEKLDFRSEQAVERWARANSPDVPMPALSSDSTESKDWQAADHRAFGLDRSELLQNLARRNPPLSTPRSYLLTRPGRLTRYLGPCVAETPEAARTLIGRALQTASSGGWSWDLLPDNANAVALARDFAFTPRRHLLRMVRGKDLRAQEESIYAIAGFELG
ncbi:MAG: GNAT family N-acetyltransferase [Terriglobales bacterium]